VSQKRKIILLVLFVVGLTATVWLLTRREKPVDADVVEVPLGVEEAMIITYQGPAIEPLPYAYGVGVNVRLAGVRELPAGRVYDVRYIVNRAGDFDLKNYFRFTDGRPVDGLPSFKVRGLERLSKDIEARIAETEDTSIALQAWYYETLVVLGVLWIAWLLLLIFWPRRHVKAAPVEMGGATLADQIRGYLEQFEAGTLDARQQAQLELMIFRQWRAQRGMDDVHMAESLAKFRADPEVAQAYAELENWMHHPKRASTPGQVAASVRARLEKAPAPTVEALTP
jgi:hypothetical protein